MAARVMIMAGGTGGHVYPALAVAQALRQRGCEVSWLGTPDSFEARVVPQYDIPLDTIASRRLRGQGLLGRLLAPWYLLHAMWQAWRLMRRRQPSVLLGMGGFASGPGGLVGRLLRLPLVIHEQNTVPGLTNRWLARLASISLQAFPHSFAAAVGARVCGNPVRTELLTLDPPEQRFARRSADRAPRLLVLGGSLGAQALNELVPLALARLPAAVRPSVLHQAGRGKADSTSQQYAALGVKAQVQAFVEDMSAAYAQADLVICRAGALTVTELAAVGVGAILVPFPFAVDDHQTQNARFLSEAGAAQLIQQADLEPAALADLLQRLFESPETLLQMASRAHALAHPRATECVADACLEVAS